MTKYYISTSHTYFGFILFWDFFVVSSILNFTKFAKKRLVSLRWQNGDFHDANNYFLFTRFVWGWYCTHNNPFCLVVHQSMSKLLSFRGYLIRNETSYGKVWNFVFLLLIILKFYFIRFYFILFKPFYTKLILIDLFFLYEHLK